MWQRLLKARLSASYDQHEILSSAAGVRQAALALLAGLVQHPGVVAVLQKVCSRVLCQILGFRAVCAVLCPLRLPVCASSELGAQWCGSAFPRLGYCRARTSMNSSVQQPACARPRWRCWQAGVQHPGVVAVLQKVGCVPVQFIRWFSLFRGVELGPCLKRHRAGCGPAHGRRRRGAAPGVSAVPPPSARCVVARCLGPVGWQRLPQAGR